jgi:hypothetical protein
MPSHDLPERTPGKEQTLLRHARREGLLIMGVWLLTIVWSIGSGYFLGYNLKPDQVQLVFGMPAWVFWSVVLPWGLCLLFSVWFCFRYMADDDLGQDPEEGDAP